MNEKDGGSKSGVPLAPSDPPFRDLVERSLAVGGLAETRRGVAETTQRRLADLEELHRLLTAQAQRIVDDAERDLDLHDVRFSCVPRRGRVYFLYERGDDRWFSILSPEEYARADERARFCGAYRLNYDNSWELVDGAGG